MPKPRKLQVSLDATPYYHCVSRCVRRAFLCGHDPFSGRSYEHRRAQIERELLRLASIFFIDVAAFAVMSNHYHAVLHVDHGMAKQADAKDIVKRWHQLYKPKDISLRYLDGDSLQPHELVQIDALIDTWRARLFDISWFMRVLNETIARQANKEDDVTGHFWESRFKSQALLDEKAVLSAMAYVDLNPIRAAMATTPETSDYTSIRMRIEYWKDKADTTQQSSTENLQPKSLLPFAGNLRQDMPKGIIFNLVDYLELVDWTGRAIRDDKRGSIPSDALPILQRLEISPQHWLDLTTNFESRFKGIAGTAESIKRLCANFGLSRQVNRGNSQLLYG